MCQTFLANLPEDKRNQLLAPYLKPSPVIYSPIPPPLPAKHTPRDRIKENSNANRQKTRNNQSGSRKRRQTEHADQSESAASPKSFTDQPAYSTVPVFVQNTLPVDIKNNPKKLHDIFKEAKPEANIKSISICKSGDIKLIGQTPHDENILRQTWSKVTPYGQFIPRLPKNKTANHEATILNLPTCITKKEIEEKLRENLLQPKDIYRFNKKGSDDPSMSVKVTFGSKQEKENFISHGFAIYSQHFRVVENKPLPTVNQCFKCQNFGHLFFQCTKTESTCLRCSGNHRLSACTAEKLQAKCANCSGQHAANYKGCAKYKEAVKVAKDKEDKKKTYANVAAPAMNQISQMTPESIMACLAESLSELVSHFKECLSKGTDLDDMKPFSIVSDAANRHLNLSMDANKLALKSICPSPIQSTAKPPDKNSQAGCVPLQSLAST